jgi:hypothetical protein
LPSTNQTLGTALGLTFHNNVATASGVLASANEADLFRVSLRAGDVVTAQVDAQHVGSPLESVLRVFDGSGRPIALANGLGDLDPGLTFQAATTGTYYLGVSARGNAHYDPHVRNSGTGQSTGLFALRLTQLHAAAPQVTDLVGAALAVSETTGLWGDTLTLSYTIDNRGGASAAAFDTTVLVSTTAGFNATVLPIGTISVSGLAADSETTGTLTVTLPGAPASFPASGTVYLGLQVDAGAIKVPEIHQGQNGVWRQGLNAASFTILQQGTPALPNGSAVSLPLPSRVTGQLGAQQTADYQLDVTEAGRLTVRVQANGIATQLALYDGQGDLLRESNGQSPTDLTDLIDQHLAPGTYRLVVSVLAGTSGNYTLTAAFQQASAPAQIVPTGSGSNVLVSGDFNGDGIPDLVVQSTAGNGLQVLLGNGDGTFQQGQAVTLDGSPVALVAGDFTGNGLPDLAVTENGSVDPNTGSAGPGEVQILLNNGDGTFQVGQTLAIGSYPVALVAGDFTGDGHTDLVVAVGDPLGLGTGGLQFFLGSGVGTFQPGQPLSVPTSNSAGQSLVAGDFNSDGRTDLAVLAGSSDTVQIVLGNGDGTFHVGQTLATGSYPRSLVAGDFTGDGRTDLAVANAASNTVQVLLGNGNGTFSQGQTLAVGKYPLSLAAGDFSGDGRTDLAVADNSANDLQVLLGNGDGTFQVGQAVSAGNLPVSLVAADFQGNGSDELAALNSGGVQVLLGNGDGTFRAHQIVASSPYGMVAGHFSGTGPTDLAIANFSTNEVQILLGNGDGTYRPGQALSVGGGPFALAAGDFNGDGRTDLAVADQASDEVEVLLGNGDGTFRVGQVIALPSGVYPQSLVAGDFTGNGILDLAVAELGNFQTPGQVQILLGKGNGTFRLGQTLVTPGIYAQSLVAGDFTGDGVTDLAVAEQGEFDFNTGIAAPSAVSVLLGNGDGTFQQGQVVPLPAGMYPKALAAGDFLGDGLTDLALATNDASGSGNVTVFLGAGDGTFQVGQTLPVGANSAALVAGDFTGSGLIDLAVADSGSDDVEVLLSNGDGTFQAGQALTVGSYPRSLVAGDFTGNGRTDLAVADQTSEDVRVLLGNGDGTFSPASDRSPGPAPSQPFLVDLNNNGTPGLIVREQSGAILYRPGVPGSPGTFGPPVLVNPGAPAQDVTIVTTPAGNLIAALDAAGSSVTEYALQPDGTFQVVQTLSVPGGEGVRIAADPLNGGSFDDLVVATSPGNQILVYTQQPDGTFSGPSYQLATDAPPSNIQFASLAGNGLQDIIACNPATSDVSLFLNNSMQPFSTVGRLAAGSGPYDLTADGTAIQSLDGTSALVAGRFNETDPIDLLALNSTGANVTLLRGTGVAGVFFDPQVVLKLGFTATQMVAGDFNGDGHLDLAFLDPKDAQVVVYLGDGTGHFTRGFSSSAGRDPSGLAVAGVNGDGILDLLVGSETGDVLILIGKGDGTFRPPLSVHGQRNLALTSYTGTDGTVYFVSANKAANLVTVQDTAGNITFTADAGNGLDAPSAVAVADLNGDGRPDLLVANSSSNELLVFLGTGPGSFASTPLAVPVGTDPGGITVADLIVGSPGLPGNGIPDVVVANEGSNTLTVLFGQGQGSDWTLVGGPQLVTGAGPVATVVAKLTGPNNPPDLIVSNSQDNTITVLPGVGLGYFADNHPITISTGRNGLAPGPLFLGHFGGSGLDLVTLNLHSNTLSYFADFPQHFATATGPTRTLFSGGKGPVAAVVLFAPGASGYSELIVANQSGTLAFFNGGPSGLTLTGSQQVGLSGITGLALGAGGTIIVGGVTGVVTVALDPVAVQPVQTAVASATPAAPPVNQQPAPAVSSPTTLAAAPFLPPEQTSGTASVSEAAAPTAVVSSGSAFDPVAALANPTGVIAVEVSPLALHQAPALGADLATTVLTGAKPIARLLPQRKGTAEALAATLTREDVSGAAGRSLTADPDQPLNHLPFLSYENVLPRLPQLPGQSSSDLAPGAGGAGKPPPPPGHSRLGPRAPWEDADVPLHQADPLEDVVAGLAIALLAAMPSGADWKRSPPHQAATDEE